jgi:DNA-binding FadR family transcriptional regulator
MPPKRSEVIAQRIVRDIRLNGQRTGDALPTESELLAKYHVGRGTLREAMRILELQGVVEIRPGRGGGPLVAAPNSRHLASTFALLMQFSETTFRSVIETRGHIEPVAAAMCAQRKDESTVLALKGSVERMRLGLNDEEVFLRENHLFHSLIADGTHNPLIGYIANSLDWIIDGSPLGVQYSRADRRSVLDIHAEIAEAIEAGKATEASLAMRRHMSDSAQYFERKYPKVMDQVVTWELYGM